MTKAKDLTAHQRAVLEHALDQTGGRIEWFPGSLKGAARTKLLESLEHRSLVRERGKGWVVTKAAGLALGRAGREVVETPARRSRADSKQAMLIEMLKRPEGATSAQLQAATQWQPHTVRGFIAGTLRKKLQLDVRTERNEAGELVYRVR
jgi:hypothetical protein